MKYFYAFLTVCFFNLFAFSQQTVTYSVNPPTFDETESITVTFTGINETAFGVTTSHALYLWGWSLDAANVSADCPTNGTWTSSGTVNKLTYVSPGVYTYTMNPTVAGFYNRTNLSKIGFLIKNLTGSVKSQDIILAVGKFQMNLTNPVAGSTNIVSSGTNISVTATTSLPATFELKANGITVNSTSTASTSYNYTYNVTADASIELVGTSTQYGTIQSKSFVVALTPNVQSQAIPSWIRQGINYDTANPGKVGLALYAPNKSYVHVIGSFNNWAVNNNYLMKRDTTNPNLYWIEISGLTSQQIYTFQYRSNDGIKVADPYSRLVLSPDDDPWISATTYPNLPAYPTGQKYDVSVIQTGMPTYPWTVTNFAKPAKDNLLVYELLVRDFTVEQNWQATINKLPYLRSLGINAIELMPVMEFEGNNSWGYNPSFHFALDKAYGTSDKFKEFIDLCHQNGIAIILDIALNHATQRSPLIRLWNNDPDGDGYGTPSSTNPYFNTVATHTYGVNEDFNHSKAETQYYVNRVLEQWISEYKIDGFRWDLTKGFTQNCSTTNEACTGSYQQDRVDVLKTYADYQWAIDPSSIIIFEHLGTDPEEQEWANYRLGEGKGIITWDIQNNAYNQNTMAWSTNSNFSRIDHEAHGFGERRNVAYAESHDEERLAYRNLNSGNTNGAHDTRTLNNTLLRLKAQGAVLLPVPGPKMIWQFGELGFDLSINRCQNGTVNNACRTDPKPSAFTLNYHTNAARKSVYDTWAKIINIRKNNDVFNTSTYTVESGNLIPRIYIWKDALPSTSLKNVVILANFSLTAQNVVPNFPYTGTWYNLMDNSSFVVSNTAATISLQPGEFRIFGNGVATVLGTTETSAAQQSNVSLELMQNPVTLGNAKFRYSNAKGGTITIFDFSGKVIKTEKVTNNEGEITIDVNGFSTGNYLVQLRTDKGNAVTKMTVK